MLRKKIESPLGKDPSREVVMRGLRAFIALLGVLTLLSMVVFADKTGEIVLKIGQQTELTSDGSKIRFVEVVEDSRCPEGVDCVWAGLARIKIEIEDPGAQTRTIELDTLEGTDKAIHKNTVILFKNLAPYPKADSQIDPCEYIATLELSTKIDS